jgi:hypothetical protein
MVRSLLETALRPAGGRTWSERVRRQSRRQ